MTSPSVSFKRSAVRSGTKGKGCDNFVPVGPWLVTRDEVIDVQQLDLYLELNGKRMQTGSTATMIFTVAQIVSDVSPFMTLEAGDPQKQRNAMFSVYKYNAKQLENGDRRNIPPVRLSQIRVALFARGSVSF